MPEEQEVETRELQETIGELQEERRERQEEERRSAWTRYVALSTAILAVFAAIGALESGSMVNEAMMLQIRASDTWNEYQADRQKELLYTLQAETLVDRGARVAPQGPASGGADPQAPEPPTRGRAATEGAGEPKGPARHAPRLAPRQLAPDQRLAAYVGEARREAGKEEGLSARAREMEAEAQHRMHGHHAYARAVALIQVSIALAAVAALTRIRAVWFVSLAVGGTGLVLFAYGLMAR